MATVQDRLLGLIQSRALRYLAASAAALAIDYTIYVVLAQSGLMSVPNAAVAGYAAGLVAAYWLIVRFVFRDGWLKRSRAAEVVLFALSGLLGIGLTYGATTLYLHYLGESIHAAKLLAVCVSFFGVYVFRLLVVFGPGGKKG